MHTRTTSLVAAAAFLVGCSDEPRLAVDPPLPVASVATATPGALDLTVELPPSTTSPSTEVWLRDAAGATRFHFLGRDGTFRFEGLEPGRYDVAARIGFEVNGPWIFAHTSVDLSADAGRAVTLGLPQERGARLALRTEGELPPFVLVLARAGTEFPTDLPELQARLDQARYPDGLVFMHQSDGRTASGELPPLPAGAYVALQVAIDHQAGDPPPAARTLDLVLENGATRELVLANRLQTMTLR
jgi:hypothetical protein